MQQRAPMVAGLQLRWHRLQLQCTTATLRWQRFAGHSAPTASSQKDASLLGLPVAAKMSTGRSKKKYRFQQKTKCIFVLPTPGHRLKLSI